MVKRYLILLVVCAILIGMMPIAVSAETGVQPAELPVFNSRAAGDTLYAECEPNDTMSDAGPMENDDTYYGTVSGEDLDVYTFVLTEKSSVAVVLVEDTSYAAFGIYDASGAPLLESVDLGLQEGGVYADVISYELDAGTYFIGVWDGNYGSSAYILYLYYESVDNHEHDWEKTLDLLDPDCVNTGRALYVCAICGESEYRDTPALGHVYADGFCTVCGIEEQPFADIQHGAYYYEPVKWAVEQGITTGMTPTTFVPDGSCTRAQVVTFLWRAMGCPEPISSDNPFTDVPAGEWYSDAVLWAVEKGITLGTSESTFDPELACTRGQIVTFLWRFRNEPVPTSAENPFWDVSSGQYYYNAVLWAVENGITNGMGDGRFAPDDPCTRCQIVTFLYRADEADVGGAEGSVQYEHQLVDQSYYDQEGLLRIQYSYDKIEILDQTQAAQTINASISQDAQNFLNQLSLEDQQEYAASPWIGDGHFWYTAESEVTNNANGIFSICVTTSWCMGGVHNLNYYGLSFDLNSGNEIDLAELLEMSEADVTSTLKDIAWTYLSQNYEDAMFEDAYETLYGYTYDDFLYYFRDNQLILTFPTYALGSGASGAFTVPTGLFV